MILLQWKDDDGSWHRGRPVIADQSFLQTGRNVNGNFEIQTLAMNTPLNLPSLQRCDLLVMPEHSSQPVARWVNISKLEIVPLRND